MAGLASISGMAVSALPRVGSPDRDEKQAFMRSG
jgi:hypothetical protein